MELKSSSNNIKKFILPSKIKSYKIEKELCTISNAHICMATNLNIKEKVLIKIYDKEILQQNSDEIFLINNEIFMMRLINHKNILKLYEIIESPSYIFLIMEYFNTIKLIDYIKSKKKFSEDESLNIYKQIISLLLYFHDMNIGHLNLNPNEILVDNNGNIKFYDFKYSVFYSTSDKVKCKYIGDSNFLSPEVLSEKSCYPELADTWSSGVILYLLLVGQLPFQGINNFDLQKKIMGAEFALPLNISKNMQELLKGIFEAKTEERYNLDKIINSALFKDKKINKNNLSKGFNVLATKYPIDDRIINICKTNFGIDSEELKQKLIKNIFDPYTSLYKQITTKFIRKKISTEIDLCTKKFNNYIENKKYILEDNIQNNNIKENLEKFEEIKIKSSNIKKNIEENQTKILIKLDELLKKYKNNNDITGEEGKEEKKEEIKVEKDENKNEKGEENKKETKEELKKESKEEIKIEKKVVINSKEKKEEIKTKKEVKISEKEKKIENKENRDDNKENISKKKNNLYNSTNPKKEYKKRISMEYNSNKINKLNTYENQINPERRMSSGQDNNEVIKKTFERLHTIEIANIDSNNSKAKKYLPNKKDIIKESKEEEKKEQSHNSSQKSSKKTLISKTSSKIIEENLNNNNKKEQMNISAPNNKDKKDLKKSYNLSKSVRFNREKKNINNITNTKTKPPPPQVTKDEFFKQIKNVKLKKYTPNTYINPDEIKRKPKEENKNTTSVEYTNVSVKNVLKMVEDNLKNAKKTKNNLSAQNRKEVKKNKLAKSYNFSIKKSQPTTVNKSYKKRKTIKIKELNMFQKKDLMINKSDIKKEKYKDDVSRFKYKVKNTNDIIYEENVEEFVLPKDYNTERKIKEERRRKYEEKKRKEIEEKRKRKEKEEKDKKELEEKRRKELEEKKMKEIEEKRIKREREEKAQRDLEQKKRREIEEKQRKEQEELRLRLLEEERIKKELEEEEKARKEREEEEERQRIAEEEMKRKREEERARKMKEREEEDKRREEEERIRKEKEKERIRLEEEEKIRKWKEEVKRQKEEEERKKKELEEKERREEEEKERKRREESERKRREIQEENRKRLEEYEKMRKAEEEKLIMREKLKKKKEEEIRKKREMELKERKEGGIKQQIIRKKSESEYESSEEENKQQAKSNEIKQKFGSELNKSQQSKEKNNKYTLHTNPFEIYKSQYSDDISPKVNKKKSIKKSKVTLQVIKKKRKTGPKLVDLNKFRESELYPSEESSSEEERKEKDNKIEINNSNKEKIHKKVSIKNKNLIYNKFTDFFFNQNIYNSNKNKNKENKIVENKQKINDKNNKKLFYHYQHNQGKEEQKSFYERNYQRTSKNVRNISLEKRMNNSFTYNNNSNKKNKVNIPSNNIKPIKMNYYNNSSKNKPYINNNDYLTEINNIKSTNTIKNLDKISSNNNVPKNTNKKVIIKMKTERAKIKTLPKDTDNANNFLNNSQNMKNNTINNISNLNKYLEQNSSKNKNYALDQETFHYFSNSLLSNNTLPRKKNITNFSNISEFDANNSNEPNKTMIKIKKNIKKAKSKANLKEADLNLYKGEINYNNVTAKNYEDCINELMTKYKSKGYTCVNKNKNKYKFVKGPNIHNVEIMRLGNGLLYFNGSKL